ncbi:hypothetical protein THAR02_11029 [Trichoderma harzianum]|uniref:C2H2-type domain-containing protein n=1 Tax=Trichoderma harzianum TaxID=5544 RepID=A0A0F9Z8F6_TRIHA|nr:hypothetical protein THAR02_11029 [Trichoderma harzianum]
MAPGKQDKTTLHQCDECTVSYTSRRHLERHRKIHAKLREREKARRRNHRLQIHINDYHFKETDERKACARCVLYKMPCKGAPPCKWCKLDGKAAECVIAFHRTPVPVPAPPAAISPQQQEQVEEEGPQDDTLIQQGALESTSGHASAGWSTPRPNSPTDSILCLPPRPRPNSPTDTILSLPPQPLPPMDIDIKADSLSSTSTAPGEINIRAGSLSWLDFEVAYLSPQTPLIQRLISYNSHARPPRDASDGIPLDASLVVALDSLGLLFKEPYIPQIMELSELVLVPGIELLRQLVDNYFLKWQKIQPVFHAPTWKFAKCPMVVLGAMACVGAVFDEDDEVVYQAHHISARCVSELNIMATRRAPNSRDIMYLAAVCLHQAYLLGSGDENIHGQVNGVRSFLIDSLKSLKLLGSGMGGRDRPAQERVAPTRSEHAEWTAWVARELEIRTTWAVFEFDCSYSLLTNSPCAIDLRDLPLRFPCSDELYDAPDAQSWANLRFQSPYCAQGPLVSTVVAATAAKTVLSDHISPWSKRLCTQVLERILRGSTKLIRHYTHLTVYSDVMDLITYIARAAASRQSPNCRTSLRWAQQKLIEQFAQRPYKSRQYVWHAGQMIRIAKIYAMFVPCDNLRIFTAYLTILAFAKYGPRSLRDVEGVEPFPIDRWPQDEKDIENWLQFGGPAKMGSCTGIQVGCRTENLIQESFHMLYRLEHWGISERLFSVLLHFNDLGVLD